MFEIVVDNNLFKDYYLNNTETQFNFLPKGNTINIIIGSNNSGKSRFIRNLVNHPFKIFEKNEGLNKQISDYNKKIGEIEKYTNERLEYYKRKNYPGDQNVIDSIKNNILEYLTFDNLSRYEDIIKLNIKRKNILNNFVHNITNIDITFSDSLSNSKLLLNKNKIYIPTLRTAHSLYVSSTENIDSFKKLENDILLDTYYNSYKIDKEVKLFTGLQLYIEVLNSRNSDRKTRERFQKFEDFISNSFFNGKKIDIVANFDKRKNMEGNNLEETITIHIDGESNTRKIHDLGDGIQALIVLMYQIFMADKDSCILIDEPELNLHPGMQRLFLEQISNNKHLREKNLKYFITTHSNHFLDLTIEKENVSIYSFSGFVDEKGENKFIIKNVNNGDNRILKDLGVNNSSVFLANSSIWVEGISDRNYIKAFLKSYLKYIKKSSSLKEDIDFTFFEYAGSNIKHYLFNDTLEDSSRELILKDINAFSLNNRVFLVADSDMAKKGTQKWNRLKTFEENKKDDFFPKIIWEIREIENLLTSEIWVNILIELCNKNLVEKYKKEILDKIKVAISEVKLNKFKKKYIGNYLNEIRIKLGKKDSIDILNKSIYKSNGETFGTLVNKRYLSEIVFERDFSWEIFAKSEEIKKLTEEIYDFIKKE